ncbi:MAG: hypothetical protein LW834_08030 [Cyanobium sp. 49614_E6]|nr:hypothetical protein [Cyanobium sp. 49614_E6]MCE2836897.1 hypothetical protein [Cyanobium sp. 49614_E6]
MKVDLATADGESASLLVSVCLTPSTPVQRAACETYTSPHRRCRLAIPTACYRRWQEAHLMDDATACRDLLADVMLLWDRQVVMVANGDGFLWEEIIPHTVLVDPILERLRWAEQPGEVVLALEQLLLEKELHQQVSDHWPADQGALHGSAAGRRQTP